MFKKVVFFLIPVLLVSISSAAQDLPSDKNIIELWGTVKAPPAPALEPVACDPATTALLVLDVEERTMDPRVRPRAVASVPKIAKLLNAARGAKVFVVYSNTGAGSRETILKEAAPLAGDPIVKSGVDKFYNTLLEKILLDRKIKTVIIVGTAAEGAVLHTATGAAIRGLQVVVPVEGMSSATLYAEQYVCFHLLNAPGTRGKVKLTGIDKITFNTGN
jgi:nicotinamidase-related amidase